MKKQYCTPNIYKNLKLNGPSSTYTSMNNPMSSQSALAPPSQTTMSETACLTVTSCFQPGICGDGFNKFESLDNITRAHVEEQIDQLKVMVRELLTSTTSGFSHQLKLIDDIQRLGVAYHFETELGKALENIHAQLIGHDGDLDLDNESLRFRLLRQHGYNISSGDIFSKFKDAKGSFREGLSTDVLGLLSLYEATHFRVHGEEILEEALVFTTKHLELAISQVSYPLTAQISEALERPLRRCPERIYTRKYMPIYQATTSHNEALLKLAKLDFNLVQYLYKEELSEVTRWWKELEFEKRFPLARHRLVECYFWMVGMYFEPQYSFGRKTGAKMCTLATMLDDVFDSYGATYEELKIFNEAMDRWDINFCMDGLPTNLKMFYHSLFSEMKEIEEELKKQGLAYQAHYVKQILKSMSRDYLTEAKWVSEGRTLTMEEYMPVRVRSVGVCMTVVFAVLGMSGNVTKEAFDWILQWPKSVWASSIIFRVMDDIAGSNDEKEPGDSVSCIECYMKQYRVSWEEAIDVFNKQLADSWKDMNEGFLKPIHVPLPVLMLPLNFARNVDLVYKEDDGFKHVGKVVNHGIAALFGDPVPLE